MSADHTADAVDQRIARSNAYSAVVRAALYLAATDWDNGRLTADDSHSLDYAHDLLEEALQEYVRVATLGRPDGDVS
jgi:hypothetical protein